MASGAAPPGAVVAVTGAAGFVGRHAVAALAAAGYRVRLLLRSEPAQPAWQALQPEVVLGSLEDTPALRRLVQGADAVLHLAGAIKARDAEAFMRVNRDGTAALAEAIAAVAPRAQLLQVSSLAAREPQLSGYAASKRAGEARALAILGRERLSVLRPPAIYGPGDRETLSFFKLASLPLTPLPGSPAGRIAVLHVADAVAAFVERLRLGPSGRVEYLADARPEGYSWREILEAAAAAVGNTRPRFVQMPRPLMHGLGLAGSGAARLAGQAAMFNAGKLRELLHEDWSVPRSETFVSRGAPVFGLASGFVDAANWYRINGWLQPSNGSGRRPVQGASNPPGFS